jgi:hypothetical protein
MDDFDEGDDETTNPRRKDKNPTNKISKEENA